MYVTILIQYSLWTILLDDCYIPVSYDIHLFSITEDINSLKRLMSEPCCRAIKASAPALIKHMNYRDVMNALLRKQLLNIKQAESIGSKANHEERAQQLLAYLTHCDQKAFEVLCDELKQNDDTSWLAEELRVRAAGRNAEKAKDSDSVGSSFLRGASQGWRGSQGSQGSVGNTSISNWSTYSRSSYGSTGSYIRRPYGSYITREPTQSYRRNASTASTPQQPRKDPGAPAPPPAVSVQHRQQEENPGALSTRADYVRKPESQRSVEEVRKTTVVKTNQHQQREDWKRLSNINEFSADQLSVSRQQTPVDQPSDIVPPAVYEVEVATTAYMQSEAPQASIDREASRYEHDTTPRAPAYDTNIDSYIVPDIPGSRVLGRAVQNERQPPQLMDDEADIDSVDVPEPMHSRPQSRNSYTVQEHKPVELQHTDVIAPSVPEPTQPRVETTYPEYTDPSQYETDIDAYIIPDQKQDTYLEEEEEKIPPQQQPQQRQPHHPQYKVEQPVYPREERFGIPKRAVSEMGPTEPALVETHEQLPRHPDPHRPDAAAAVRANQREYNEFENQPVPMTSQDNREDPASSFYKETDLDGPPERPQIPRDGRVKSTGDISHHVPRDSSRYPMAEVPGSLHSRPDPRSQMAQGRGRPKSRSVVDLIGNADLGPTHVLQDMDPIELPLTLKRSRSSSLNRSLRRPKNKSPVPLNGPEDRHTWAVPYDWEQHNSCESLNKAKGDANNKRRSGGFVFAASAFDVRSSSSGNRRPTSGPPKYSSQPMLIPENDSYSMPRPTGRRKGTLDKYEYIEPLPMPPLEQLEASQSVPIQRREMPPTMAKPPLPPHNASHSRPNPQSMQNPGGYDQRRLETGGQQGHLQPHQPNNRQHADVQNQSQGPPRQTPISSRMSDSSEATESYHTGRSRIGSDDSDDATITSNCSELTMESYRTTRSHNPSIGSRALSQGSYMSAADSFHTGRSYSNSDVPDDVTITSDISELTIDSFHTFNSGMTPTNRSLTSPNHPDLTMVSQLSDVTLDSFQSCRLSDDEVTLTSKGSNSPEPFSIDSTPNKHPPVKNSAWGGVAQRPGSARRPQGPPPGVPTNPQMNRQLIVQPEENAPPVPPRKDLQNTNQAPPIPVRPSLYSDAPAIPQPRPAGRSVTFADDHNQQLHVGAPVARVKQAKTVPLPRTDPQWSPGVNMNPALAQLAEPEGKKSKKKKKGEKKTKKTLLPYVGTTPEHDKAVRIHAGNGNGHPPYLGEPRRDMGPHSGDGYQGQHQQPNQPTRETNLGAMLSNNNTTVAEARKEIVQSYIDSIAPQSGMRTSPHPVNQQVYTVHAQSQPPHMDERQMSMRVDPRMHGSTNPNDQKPHAYVQPYIRSGRGGSGQTSPWTDNVNSNNGNLPSRDFQGANRDSEKYPFKGGNGNGIVLVEQPYIPTTESNANIAPYQQPPTTRQQNWEHAPNGGAQNLAPTSRAHVTMPRMGTRSPRGSPRLERVHRDITDGRAGDRSSIASQDRAFYVTSTGAKDTAV